MTTEVNANSIKMEGDYSSFWNSNKHDHYLEQQRLDGLKSDIHSKGSLLSTTWNDLYKLLSQYQAELFLSSPNIDPKSIDPTISQLKKDLYQKDSLLAQLQHKLSTVQHEVETVRMDLTVKNSLLKKYQEDLLEKEAALLTSQATIRKLENKSRMMESRLQNRNEAIKTQSILAQKLSQHIHPVFQESYMKVAARSSPSPHPMKKGSLINASISAISQKRRSTASHIPNKRKSTPPSQTIQTPTNLADDDDIQDIISSISASSTTNNLPENKMDTLYCNNNNSTNDHTISADHSIFPSPDTSQTVFPEPSGSGGPVFPGQENAVFPGQEIGGAVFPGQEPLLNQGHIDGSSHLELHSADVPLPDNATMDQIAQNWPPPDGLVVPIDTDLLNHRTSPKRSPKGVSDLLGLSPRVPCPQCEKTFTRPKDVKRHVNTVHLKLRSYGCPGCDKRFTRKEHSLRHMARCLGEYSIPYHNSLVEVIDNTAAYYASLEKQPETESGTILVAPPAAEESMCQSEVQGNDQSLVNDKESDEDLSLLELVRRDKKPVLTESGDKAQVENENAIFPEMI